MAYKIAIPASLITSGTTALANGGTNVDLSASGGTTSLLAQNASHVISARTLVAADISGLAPAIVATINLTGQVANIGATTLYAVPSSGAGLYRVSAYVVETTAGSLTSTLPNVQMVYTDVDTNTSITIDATPILGIAGIGQTGALTANTIGTASAGSIVVALKASTNIQYQTVNYASNIAGMAYSLRIRLEAI